MIGRNNAEEKDGWCIRGKFIILFCPKAPCRGNRLVAPGKRPSGAPPGVTCEGWNGRICKGSANKKTFYAPDQASGKNKRGINRLIMNSRSVYAVSYTH